MDVSGQLEPMLLEGWLQLYTCLPGTTLNLFTLDNGGAGWILLLRAKV